MTSFSLTSKILFFITYFANYFAFITTNLLIVSSCYPANTLTNVYK